MTYPIIEFDKDKGIISPEYMIETGKIPTNCILCFFPDVYSLLEQHFQLQKKVYLSSPLGKHTIYVIIHKNMVFSVFNPGLGGPMAAGFLEELIALGARKFVLCGSAGALENIAFGTIILPSFAIRDEGTSYHYLSASEKILIHSSWRKKISNYFKKHNINFIEGGTWTTDAIYRETAERKKRRMKQGCICVDMEVASLEAVSQFRKVGFVPVLYSGDMLSNEWDSRNWKSGVHSQIALFQLCCDFMGDI